MRVFAVVAFIVVAGLPNLPRPMHGDQVLTLMGAESLARGELPYRDFWDIRQPGLIVEFWLAGSIFGFNELGMHLFDLLFWLIFAAFVTTTWPRLVGREGLSVWPALLTSGWYCAVTGGVQQMQAEAIVGPILYLHLWLLMRCSRLAWISAGVVAACVLSLKLMFLPLLGVIYLFAVLRLRREKGPLAVGIFTGWYLIALTIILLLAMLPWLIAGEFDQLVTTFFVHPRQMLDEVPRPSIARLGDAAEWFATRYGPLFILAAIGFVRLWRSRRGDWATFLVAWLIIGAVIIVAQRFSWWSYHFMLLTIPLGLLAAEGCNSLIQTRRPFWIGVLALLLVPAVLAVAFKWTLVGQYRFCLTSAERESYRLREDAYRIARDETAFLHETTSRPGSIFVAGEPIFHRYANRPAATPVHGWSLELYPAAVRDRLTQELWEARPAYIFVESVYYDEQMLKRYRGLEELLTAAYKKVRSSANGIWYERK